MERLSRTRAVARTAVLAAFAAGPSLGCKVVIERANDSTRPARSDTVVTIPYTPPAESTVVAPRPPAPRPQTSVADGDVSDTGSGGTTSADLAMLAAELIVPLPGVKPSELRDTFNEARGGGTRKHEALDIMAPRGTPVLSASAGRVLKLHNSKDGGLLI